MDQAGKYELLIGEKLEQIPLPDLVESIWARIETELDTDLPDGNDQGPDAGPIGGPFWRRGLFVLFGALVMTFFFYPNNKNQNIESNIVLPATETITPENNLPDKPPPNQPRANRTAQPKQRVVDSTASPDPVLPQQVNLTPSKLDDSLKANVPSLVVNPPPPVIKDSAGKKKSRGVKGLNDDDYRIVPKRDTTR